MWAFKYIERLGQIALLFGGLAFGICVLLLYGQGFPTTLIMPLSGAAALVAGLMGFALDAKLGLSDRMLLEQRTRQRDRIYREFPNLDMAVSLNQLIDVNYSGLFLDQEAQQVKKDLHWLVKYVMPEIIITLPDELQGNLDALYELLTKHLYPALSRVKRRRSFIWRLVRGKNGLITATIAEWDLLTKIQLPTVPVPTSNKPLPRIDITPEQPQLQRLGQNDTSPP